MTTQGSPQPNAFATPAPKLEQDVRELASAKLEAVKDFYEARAKIARLNAELFEKGWMVGHDLMAW